MRLQCFTSLQVCNLSAMSSVALTDLSIEFGKIICIIALGYGCGRNHYISFKKRTLAQLLSKLILPTVFFYSTATMNLFNINFMIAFLGLLSRFIMMFIYYIPIRFMYHNSSFIDKLQYWSISTLFVTMSYDIPIGYPIAKILWNENNDSQYILTWAALSKIFVMSLCIAILNYCKTVKAKKKSTSSISIIDILIHHCMTNPIIVGIFCGLSINVFCVIVLKMESIPQFLREICIMIKNSYPFTALFIIGFGISETKVSLFNINNKHKNIILLLVVGKCVISPIVFHSCFKYILVNDTSSIHNNIVSMACFYGMLPVSASPTVLSIQYKLYNDIMEMATIICLIVSMPMLISFVLISNDQILTDPSFSIPNLLFHSST